MLSDGNRANAIAALIRAGKLGADFPDKPSPSVSCDAPSHVIDKPSPTCRERWQTALFRENIGKIFFAFSEYVDAWQHSAETGEKLTNAILTLADMVKFGWDFKKQPDLAKRTVVVLTKGNSLLLMLGFSNSETLGAEIASEAIQTIRNGIETLVEYGLEGSVKASGVPIDLAKLANKPVWALRPRAA